MTSAHTHIVLDRWNFNYTYLAAASCLFPWLAMSSSQQQAACVRVGQDEEVRKGQITFLFEQGIHKVSNKYNQTEREHNRGT